MKNGYKAILLILLLIILGLVFSAYLIKKGLVSDFRQFVLDRREGAGQDQPDINASCNYEYIADSDGEYRLVKINRKAHGQKQELTFELSDSMAEPFKIKENLVMATRSKLETFNCVNAHHDQGIALTTGFSASQILFSASGKNLAVISQNNQDNSHVDSYQFLTNPKDPAWNNDFGPKNKGITGQLVKADLVGESLVVVFGGLDVHTYNFRKSHINRPWNEHNKENKPLNLSGAQLTKLEFDNLGKLLLLKVQQGQNFENWTYDFSCKQTDPTDKSQKEASDKPCRWEKS